MSYFPVSRFGMSERLTDKLHDARHAISALLHHFEGTRPLSSLEVDQFKQQIEQALKQIS